MWTPQSSQATSVQTPSPKHLDIPRHPHHLKWGIHQVTYPPHPRQPRGALIWTWGMNLRAQLLRLHLT